MGRKLRNYRKKKDIRHYKNMNSKKAIQKSIKDSALESKVNKAKHFVKNLSQLELTNTEILALGKSLNFVPNPAKPNKGVFIEAANVLARSMRIRYLASIKKWGPRHKFRNPSTWIPGPVPSMALENYLEGMKTELCKVTIKNVQPNITKVELKALNNLRKNPNIVLKKFDKGRGVCVMSRKDYISEGLRQLCDRKSYLKLEHDTTDHTASMASELVCEMFAAKEIDKALANYLDPETSGETKTPVFYMLPKIHKKVKHPAQAFIGRPIISSVSSPLNRIAQFLDFYLLPEVMKSPAYLKDTAHTIRKIESLTLPDNILLASIDVVSMFTAVPQEEALEIAMETLANIFPSSCDPPRPSLAFMSKLIKLVLYRNSSFRSQVAPWDLEVARAYAASSSTSLLKLLCKWMRKLSHSISIWMIASFFGTAHRPI